MKAHLHTVFSNLGGKNMIENIIGNGEKSIASIHRITMPKDRLPDLTFYDRILQRFETQLRHGPSLRSSVLRQMMAAQFSCLSPIIETFKPLRGGRKVAGHVSRSGFPYAPCRPQY